MSGVDEEQLGELLSAYLDNELDERETVFVQRLLEEDAAARALLDELQQTVSAVAALPRHSAPHSLAEDLEARLERSELLADFSEPADVSGPRRSSWLAVLSAAASVVLIVGGGLWVMRDSVDPEAGRRGDAVAMNTPKDNDEALRNRSLRPGGIGATEGKADRRGSSRKGIGRDDLAASKGAVNARTAKKRSAPARLSRTRDRSVPSSHGLDTLNVSAEVQVALAPKLRAGADVAAVQTHQFEAEPVRLQVIVRSQKQVDELSDRINAHLRQTHLADMTERHASSRLSRRADEAFFFPGRNGVNFDGLGRREILLRVPAEILDGVVDQLAQPFVVSKDVTLSAGSLVFNGLDDARDTLAMLSGGRRSEKRSEPMPAAKSAATRKKKEIDGRKPGAQWGVGDLFGAFGLEPADFSDLVSPPRPAVAEVPEQPARVAPADRIARAEREPVTGGSLVKRRLAEAKRREQEQAASTASDRDDRGFADRAPTASEFRPPSAGHRLITLVVEIATIDTASTNLWNSGSKPRKASRKPIRKPPHKPSPRPRAK